MSLYRLQDAADLAGLRPGTLSNYSRGYSDLVRGEDFIIRNAGPWRRQLMFTERGVRRLTMRAYRVFRKGRQALVAYPPSLTPVHLRGDVNAIERRARVKASVAQAFRAYLDHPCAVPNCPCIIHRLGAPRLDELTDYIINAVPPKPRPMGG